MFYKKIGKALKLDKIILSYNSLAKMCISILVGFFCIAVVLQFRPKTPEEQLDHINTIYVEQGVKKGEEKLVALLKKYPEMSKGWLFLVKKRFPKQLILLGSNVLLGIDNSPFLKEDELFSFLQTSTKIRADILRAFYFYYKNSLPLEHALKFMPKRPSEDVYLYSAMLCEETQHFQRALDFLNFAKEINLKNTSTLKKILRLTLKYKTEIEFERLLKQPEYIAAADSNFMYKYHLKKKQYFQIFKYMVLSQFDNFNFQIPYILTALGTGVCWYVFCIHLGFGWDWNKKSQIISILAVISGFLSTWVTLWVVIVQDDLIEHALREHTFQYNLIYCIFAIGLREEFVKLLFVLPFVPFLIKEKNNLKILIICSLVGLGFAIEENINYFMGSWGTGVFGRFLSANFLHMTLTGYIGFYLVKAFQKGGEAWNHFTFVFIQMILIHAIYDFLLIEPSLKTISFLSLTIFIWLSQQYLRLAISSGAFHTREVSMTRVFLLITFCAIGLTYLLISMNYGLLNGFSVTLNGVMGIGLISIMFFREFKEQIHSYY